MNLLEVREQQAIAFCKIYKDKLEYQDLQKSIDNYSNNLAKSLIQKCMPFLCEDDFRNDLMIQLRAIGANKKHSGKRVFEAFYRQLTNLEIKSEFDLQNI